MATKKGKSSDEEKMAKRKARMEALKNRPEGQRSNSKQVDVIQVSDTQVVKSYAMPIRVKRHSVGVLTTTIAMEGDKIISVSSCFVPGNLIVRVKKGHGIIASQKGKGKEEDDVEENDETENED